jgi:putative ABC transport system permease protein
LINETLANLYWPSGGAVGARFKINSQQDLGWATIVGVLNDVHQAGLGEEIRPELVFPYVQVPEFSSMAVAVKYAGDPAPLADAMRHAVWDLDPTLPVLSVRTMAEWISLSVVEPRFYAILFGTFAFVALALAAAGIYGTMLYAVSQRNKELGIRMALGADSGRVVAMVVRQGMLVTTLGIVVGITGALALSGALAGFVFGVGTSDPLTYGAVALLLAGVAFVGCWLPARRATRVDPVGTLRLE